MHRLVLLFDVLLLLPAAPAVAAKTPDYFAPRPGLDSDTALYLDARSGDANAIAKLRLRLNRLPAPANAYDGWSFLCSFGFHRAHYAEAAADCARAIALDPAGSDAETLGRVRLLEHQPAPRAEGSAVVAVAPGERVAAKAGGYRGAAMVDTGAQISLMMRSVATSARVRRSSIAARM